LAGNPGTPSEGKAKEKDSLLREVEEKAFLRDGNDCWRATRKCF